MFAYILAAVLVVTFSVAVNSFSPSIGRVSRIARPTVQANAEKKDDIAADKLIWDPKANRFFEAKIDNINIEDEFCLIDKSTGQPILLTREEKERIFLDSVQSYYFSGKNNLPDDEFDRLKEDLAWEGSALVSLNRNETLFMNAMQAYNKGAPIISDTEFDALKISLRESKSKIAVSTAPKCYVDTGVCKATWQPDNIRTNSLYIPAALISTIAFLGGTYELLSLVGITLNPLLLLTIGALPISSVTKTVTENVFFNDPFVATGPCPSCGVENRVFFGGALGINGDDEQSSVKCTNCKAAITLKRSTLRVSTLLPKSRGPPEVEKDD